MTSPDPDPEMGHLTGSAQTLSPIGVLSVATGCWYNLVNQDDFMVAQPWRPARWFRR